MNAEDVPSWYQLIRAAKYLGVAPWDLAGRPVWWMNIAIAAESAEAGAEKDRAKHKTQSG